MHTQESFEWGADCASIGVCSRLVSHFQFLCTLVKTVKIRVGKKTNMGKHLKVRAYEEFNGSNLLTEKNKQNSV